jgi:hypothetical protein
MSNENQGDSELIAMTQILEALKPLAPDEKARVIHWLAQKHGSALPPFPKPTPHGENAGMTREGTINTVAVRLGVKSCKDLMVAAAVHLTLYQGKDRFSRADWVACAKDAKQWKTDYSVQTSTVINRLLSAGFVNETTKDTYVVPDEQMQVFEGKLS